MTYATALKIGRMVCGVVNRPIFLDCNPNPDRRVVRRARAAGGMQIGRKINMCYHLVQADRYDQRLLTAGETPDKKSMCSTSAA